jgi:hypothetical protein
MLDMTGILALSRWFFERPSLRICPPLDGKLSVRPQRQGHAMSEQAIERQGRVSDIVGVASYSILVLLIMLAWTYVPA